MPPQFNLETAAPIIQNGLALATGGGQRVAWEVSTPLGFIVTGAMWAGGLVGTFMLDGLGRAMAMGLADSGASVAGWILTEQFLLGAGARGGSKGMMTRRDSPGSVDALSEGQGKGSWSNGRSPAMSSLGAQG